MSLRLQMLQAARLAPRVLGESAVAVKEFLLSQQNADGGFKDRSGASDLYYTVFGIECLLALGADLPAESIARYLRSRADGATLDFVHVACLARCWANLAEGVPQELRPRISARLEEYRSADGGYHTAPNSPHGSAYACFLAVGAYEDMGLPLPDPDALLACLDAVRAADGGYANQPAMPHGLTPPTAGVVAVLRQLGRAIPPELPAWLLKRHSPRGGFFATPAAPLPDLLSTATALHALALANVDLSEVAEPCLGFLDALWSNRGGFYGHLADDALDCEYAYYALLSLGHLSLVGPAAVKAPLETAPRADELAEGFWTGELAASPLATAVSIFALDMIDEASATGPRYRTLVERGMGWLADHQNDDGGWGESIVSRSSVGATIMCWAALRRCGRQTVGGVERAEAWLSSAVGGLAPEQLAAGIRPALGADTRLAAPALTLCALAGCLGDEPGAWAHVPQLPFEVAALPQWLRRRLGLPTAPEVLAPLIALGLARHVAAPAGGIRRMLRNLARPPALRRLASMQTSAGGFSDSPILTGLVVTGLAAGGLADAAITRRATEFVARAIREDGSWALSRADARLRTAQAPAQAV